MKESCKNEETGKRTQEESHELASNEKKEELRPTRL